MQILLVVLTLLCQYSADGATGNGEGVAENLHSYKATAVWQLLFPVQQFYPISEVKNLQEWQWGTLFTRVSSGAESHTELETKVGLHNPNKRKLLKVLDLRNPKPSPDL